MRDVTYREISDWLTKYEKAGLIPAIGQGFGFLVLLSTIGSGATAAVIALAADILSIRTELISLGERLLSVFKRPRSLTPLERVQRMRIAYGLLVCSAFFEALDRVLPDTIKSFRVTKLDKQRLLDAARTRAQGSEQEPIRVDGDIWTQPIIPFPHLTDNWDQQQRELIGFYEELCDGLSAFLPCLSRWDDLDDTTRQRLIDHCQNLPHESLSCFEAQYTVLAADCREFRVWARRQDYLAEQHRFDFGMKHLGKEIASLYDRFTVKEADALSATLRSWYRAQVNRPILRDGEFSDDFAPSVKLPLKSKTFIPQHFKVVRYDLGTPIGSEAFWEKLPRRQDLSDFLWAYLHSPYCDIHPLVILGHPGSGKTLLTEVFAAHLSDSPFTPIRVILRDVPAEARIAQQVDEQLRITINADASWGRLRSLLRSNPPVVIFDGYDELLQASGHVFANYITDVQDFQRDEKDRSGVGLRAIITSRMTLIGKPRIPKGATILRLLPFDEKQRARWIDTWNSANRIGFQARGVQPFELPTTSAVVELAQQPLLLLMLAIYDSYGNALRDHGDLSRASLYSQLVSLFVHRECYKEQAFRGLSAEDQETALDLERKRLGVCALGMFNRDSLSLTDAELQDDLDVFKMAVSPEQRGNLSQAEAVFGSFFFVYRSQTMEAGGQEGHVRRIAYEFLHNTFGEYLCAEFLLDRIFTLAGDLSMMRESPRLSGYRDRLLEDPDQLGLDWYSCWMHTPLSSRPMVVDLMREIAAGRRTDARNTGKEYPALLQDVTLLIHNHLASLLGGQDIPSAMFNAEKSVRWMPLLTRVAVYTLNLVVLRCALEHAGFDILVVELAEYLGQQDAWDRLVSFWSAAVPDGARWSMAGLLNVERTENGVYLKLRPNFEESTAEQPSKAFLALGLSVADDVRSEMERMFELSVSIITHELRHNLHGLMLLTNNIEVRQDRKYLDQVSALWERVDNILSRVPNIGRITTRKGIEIEAKHTSVERLVKTIVQSCEPQARQAGVVISVTYEQDAEVYVDEQLLNQALTNIVDNAVNASRKGSQVCVKAHVNHDDLVEIEVTDGGHGIREEDVAQIFQLGFTTRSSGAGVGLLVAKRIIEEFNGSIKIKSAFGKGTNVVIALPRANKVPKRKGDAKSR